MKTITKNFAQYTVRELKEENPQAFEKELENYRQQDLLEFTLDEMMQSLKAFAQACDIQLLDWSIGVCNRNQHIKTKPFSDYADLQDARAFAWFENHVLRPLRIGYKGAKRWELAKYGQYYRAGRVKPCPFTGMSYDDFLIEAFRGNLKAHMTVKEAFEALATDIGEILYKEWEYLSSEEQFIEHCEANDITFDYPTE